MFKAYKYIVVIEDNPDHQMLFTRSLSKRPSSPDVLMLNDGEEALAYIGAPGRMPDLIMLDIKVPKLDGIEILKEIRKSDRLKNAPVVMMTTSTMREDIHRSYSAGASSYLIKHHNVLQWNKELGEVLDYWLDKNRTVNSVDVV